MAIKQYLKPTEAFVKEHFYDSLIQKRFVPSKKSSLQWAKFVHDDVLAFLRFNVDTLGDFDVFYGAMTMVQNLPFGLTERDTNFYYLNNMQWAGRQFSDYPNVLFPYRSPLSHPNTYEIKLEGIRKQLEKIVFPTLDKTITPKDVPSLFRHIAPFSCYEYLYGDFQRFENKIKEIASSEERTKRILKNDTILELTERHCRWNDIEIHYGVLAYVNKDYGIFEKHIERCREFNLKLLRKNMPMLFE